MESRNLLYASGARVNLHDGAGRHNIWGKIRQRLCREGPDSRSAAVRCRAPDLLSRWVAALVVSLAGHIARGRRPMNHWPALFAQWRMAEWCLSCRLQPGIPSALGGRTDTKRCGVVVFVCGGTMRLPQPEPPAYPCVLHDATFRTRGDRQQQQDGC